MKYQLTTSGVYCSDLGASIPNDPANSYWQDYQNWLAAGNVPDAIAVPPAQPDWTNFRLGMIDPTRGPGKAYQRLCTTIMSTGDSGRLLIMQLNDAAAMEPPNIPALSSLWNAAVGAVPPTADEVAAFRTLAAATHMQFTYSDSGAMAANS